EMRQLGSTPEAESRMNGLIGNLLQLAEEIHDVGIAPVATSPVTTSLEPSRPIALTRTEREPAAGAGARPAERSSVVEVGPPSTRLEEARLLFQSRRSEKQADGESDRTGGITKKYRGAGGFEVSNLDMDLRVGEITGLIGVNGAGKTTVLRI